MRAINECLSLAAGRGGGYAQSQSPLHVLNWARTAYAQLMTRPVTEVGWRSGLRQHPQFRKVVMSARRRLAIKAHLAGWVIRNSGDLRVLEDV